MNFFKALGNGMSTATGFVLVGLALAIGSENGLGQESVVKSGTQRKAAVFVFNREPKVTVQHVKVFEDAISARVASEGFVTLTRDVILDSISRSMKQPELAGNSKPSEKESRSFFEDLTKALKSKEPVAKSLEDQLDEQSSVMRLAQSLGADLIVIAVAESFGTEKSMFKGNDLAPVATTTIVNNLRVSYRLAFAASGGAVKGDTLLVTRAWRESDSLSRQTDDVMNEMFDEAAGELSKRIVAANGTVKEVPKVQAVGVQFNVKPVLPGGTVLQLPVYENGNVKLQVSTTVAADVILDGIAVGSVPGDLKIASGVHQIAIRAEGFKPWQRFVNVSEGQKLDVLLEMTPEGYDKWKEIITFLSDLSRQTKITDAEVKQMEAKAEAMRKANIVVTIDRNGASRIER
jgi:hypothetical protein